jgi:hypothetical protein
MNKLTIATLVALLSTNAFSADFRDAVLQSSSQASESVMDYSGDTFAATRKVADYTAEHLKAIISKGLEMTAESSESIKKLVLDVSEVSKPVFKLTAEGVAIVFEVSGNVTRETGKVSEKILIKLEPTAEVTSEQLGKLLIEMSDVTGEVSQIVTKILEALAETFEKPLELTEMTVEELMEIISKASEASTEVSESILGKDNVYAGFELTSRGIALTFEGIANLFYVMSQGTSAVSNLFVDNNVDVKDVERAIERDDQDALNSIRALIRADFNERIDGGEIINSLITDEQIDIYRDLIILRTQI